MKLKVKDIPVGSILWRGNSILGIKGVNISSKYDEFECYQERGNPIDFTIIIPIKNKEERK